MLEVALRAEQGTVPSLDAARKKRWTINRAMGVGTSPVLATSVRAHLLVLMGHGYSPASIGSASGVSRTVVSGISTGLRPTCAVRTARLLLALTESDLVMQSDERTYVPSTVALVALDKWMGAGFSTSAIAAATDLSTSLLSNMSLRRKPQCAAGTAKALLLVTHTGLFASAPDLARVPSFGVRRRFEALGALGWTAASIDEIAVSLGLSPPSRTLERLGSDHRNVAATAHRNFADIYRRICSSSGPSARARVRASTSDWLPPGAWADIDDPFEMGAPAPVVARVAS